MEWNEERDIYDVSFLGICDVRYNVSWCEEDGGC